MTTSGWSDPEGRSSTPHRSSSSGGSRRRSTTGNSGGGQSFVQGFALVMLAGYLMRAFLLPALSTLKLPEKPLSLLSLTRRAAHDQAAAASGSGGEPEKEDSDVGWHAPLVPENEFRDLLPDQKYNRSVSKLWFGSMTAEEVSALREEAAALGLRYHFVLSTGHSGTTTLSKAETYEQLGFDTSSCFWGFETLGKGMRDFSRHHPSRRSWKSFVTQYYLPRIQSMTLREGKRCFVDPGHHTFFGHLLSELRRELGNEAMTVMRLRRTRHETAVSYAINRQKDGPCHPRCVHCLCPEEQYICLGGGKLKRYWGKFSIFQRFLWMVDEVECRWKALKNDDAGKGRHVEFSWNASIGTGDIQHYGKFIGLPQKPMDPTGSPASMAVAKHKMHVTSRKELERKGLMAMKGEDWAYKNSMGYSSEQREFLKPVLNW